MTVEDSIAFGDIILLAIPWRKREELRPLPSELFKNKIVIDATNPYSENFELIDLKFYFVILHLPVTLERI